MKGTNCNHGNIFESFPIGHWLITPGGHMPMMLWITASYSVTYDLDRSDFISVLSSVVHRNLCFLSSRMMFRWVSAHISRAFQSEVLLTFHKILGLSCQGNSTLQCLFVLFEDELFTPIRETDKFAELSQHQCDVRMLSGGLQVLRFKVGNCCGLKLNPMHGYWNIVFSTCLQSMG